MDIKRLKQFITLSNEDFADSHEPVNDGVKTVPDANDIAKMVGRSGGDADLTTQGEGKVIPEEPDTDDTDTEHTESDVDEGTGPGGQATDQPEVETESPVEDEPELAHDDVKAVDVDEKVTAKEKESLEAFVPKIKRSELIGYSTRDVKALTNSIGRIRAKAGIRGAFTVSAESINETIVLAETHLSKLGRKRAFLKQRDLRVAKENFVPVEEAVITEAPLAHPGAVPLPAAVGVAMTEAELQPFQEFEQGQQTIVDTLSNIQHLEEAAVAVEQFTQLLRENKGRVSKQAAAIIHTSLEHIDQVCGLRMRSTGLESFDTTPKHALESVDVNESTLGSRAREIGAKILNWLIKMMETVETLTLQFSEGISRTKGRFNNIREQLAGGGVLPEITLTKIPSQLFMDGDFVGDKLTIEEGVIPKALKKNRTDISNKLAGPMLSILKSGPASDEMASSIEELVHTNFSGHVKMALPGGAFLEADGIKLNYIDHDKQRDVPQEDITVPTIAASNVLREVERIITYLDNLNDISTGLAMLDTQNQLKTAILDLRRRSKDVDEGTFQKVQTAVMAIVREAFHQRLYFRVLGQLANAQNARATYLTNRLNARK